MPHIVFLNCDYQPIMYAKMSNYLCFACVIFSLNRNCYSNVIAYNLQHLRDTYNCANQYQIKHTLTARLLLLRDRKQQRVETTWVTQISMSISPLFTTRRKFSFTKCSCIIPMIKLPQMDRQQAINIPNSFTKQYLSSCMSDTLGPVKITTRYGQDTNMQYYIA